MVVVAQLVEPQIVILVVAGSSPVDHPTLFPASCNGAGSGESGEHLREFDATAGKQDRI